MSAPTEEELLLMLKRVTNQIETEWVDRDPPMSGTLAYTLLQARGMVQRWELKNRVKR